MTQSFTCYTTWGEKYNNTLQSDMLVCKTKRFLIGEVMTSVGEALAFPKWGGESWKQHARDSRVLLTEELEVGTNAQCVDCSFRKPGCSGRKSWQVF